MKKLYKKLNNDKIAPKEGQFDFLYGDKTYPCLDYEYVASEENLNRAFDILFEETLRIRKENAKYKNIKINSYLCQSQHIGTGSPRNN